VICNLSFSLRYEVIMFVFSSEKIGYLIDFVMMFCLYCQGLVHLM